MMKFLLFVAILLVSAHYSQQDSEADQSGELFDSVEEKPVQLPEDEATEEDDTAVQLPARDAEEDDELAYRSVQGFEEETPVQLPARKLGEELTKISKKGFKNGKATTCEGQSLTLRCGRGRVIRVVYAIYGRRNRRVCAKNKPIKTTKCRAKNSKKIAVKTCDGKRTCQLKANNGVFGDPCIGTYKYLTVIYACRRKNCKNCGKNATCVKGKCRCKKGFRRWRGRCIRRWRCSKKCAKNARCLLGKCRCRRGYRWNKGKKQCVRRGISWFKIGKSTTCEGQSLTLRCGRGRVIRVVYAIYGRRNRRVCAKNKPIKTTKCRAKNSKKIAVKTCDGKRTCQLKANNGVFGDPCIGTYKYLTVIYGCRKPCVKNAYFNGRVCRCKTGYKGQGYRRCTKRKTGRDLEEEEKRDVSDDDMDINENGLETV